MRLPPVRLRALAATLLACAAAPAPAIAQLVAGQVVQSAARTPVAQHTVRLLRHSGAGEPTVIDSARTDARGFFQLLAPEAGAYQLAMGGGDWVALHGPVDTVAADGSVERMYVLARVDTANGGRPYFEFQVDKPVVIQGGGAPRYPEELRARKVQGEVLLQWVVDATGKIEPGSIKVLKSSHPLFTQSVVDAMPRMRFLAAEKDGRPVRQVVHQPFHFALR